MTSWMGSRCSTSLLCMSLDCGRSQSTGEKAWESNLQPSRFAKRFDFHCTDALKNSMYGKKKKIGKNKKRRFFFFVFFLNE